MFGTIGGLQLLLLGGKRNAAMALSRKVQAHCALRRDFFSHWGAVVLAVAGGSRCRLAVAPSGVMLAPANSRHQHCVILCLRCSWNTRLGFHCHRGAGTTFVVIRLSAAGLPAKGEIGTCGWKRWVTVWGHFASTHSPGLLHSALGALLPGVAGWPDQVTCLSHAYAAAGLPARYLGDLVFPSLFDLVLLVPLGWIALSALRHLRRPGRQTTTRFTGISRVTGVIL